MTGHFFRRADFIFHGICKTGLNLKYVTAFFLLLAFAGTLSAARIYVAPNASTTASGQSWGDPVDLATACERATNGDEIWVRSGVYLPGQDRNQAFTVAAGVKLFGGFAGTETTLQQRKSATPSILSGNIGSRTSAEDNSYTVVRLRSQDHHYSTLDGFVIRDGMGRTYSSGFSASNAGGALFIEPSRGGNAAHRITNCVFVANSAHNGGAVYISNGRPVFTDCKFLDNEADANGGAVFNQGGGAVVSSTFQNCEFRGNSSNSGGCLTNNGANGEATVLAINCVFVENSAEINGAVIYSITRGTGDAEAILEGCSFVNNFNALNTPDVTSDNVAKSINLQRRQHGGGTLRPVNTRK